MDASPVVAFGVDQDGDEAQWRVSFPAMGTRIDLTGSGGDLRRITEVACRTVAECESLWSVFRPDSDISRINAHSGPCRVDQRTDRLLDDARALAAATGGAFTPVAGALVRLWDVKAARGHFLRTGTLPCPPSESQCRRAAALCDPSLLHRDDAGRWSLAPGQGRDTGAAGQEPDGGPRVDPHRAGQPWQRPLLDLGGIAKGATADAVRDAVREAGARSVLVSVGTSSITAHGPGPHGRPWRVGLRAVGAAENEAVGHLALTDACLSTSGGHAPWAPSTRTELPARRTGQGILTHFTHDTFDPRSGRPGNSGIRQVSIVCESGVMAEALSTALLVAGPGCVDGERLGAWAAIRNVSPRWERVIMGERGIEASDGAGWRPGPQAKPRKETEPSDA
ncbi:FAD:protein FMN transferase [Schaalia sp. 19OD2882]|uniref:FAD:protein FMN transferase n=1 Tax=Schaalia sp. 19OD2882 TaxID=2794089 RepID=UPI001C1E9D28|nr:FAD:protein FMN transferase [Schaalia sp. 19OD2882]QWW19847.1 FAD:protein FMN transferase [Schaalia sp. 19OD2882]